jgi:hypothetical protein
MKKSRLSFLVLFALLLWPGDTNALEVSLEGNRLTLRADQVPLQEILARIADLGVEVRIDARINPIVSASFKDRDIQKGLASILKSTNHALLWTSVEGPLGPIPRLAEIQVFRPGMKGLMKPLVEGKSLSIVRDPRTGDLYVANEILLRINPGTNPEEFMALLKQWGATVTDGYPPLGLYKVRLPEGTDVPAFAEGISSHPALAKAEPNFAYPIATPFHYDQVAGHPRAAEPSGTGTVPIAILDSGLAENAGLEEHVLASLDAIETDEPISDPLGHGTQMALVASGLVMPHGVSGGDEMQHPIIPIRAFDEKGFTSNYTIMRSIDFALAHGARVMNLSWGSEKESGFLEEAFRYAQSKGMILLASAGNEPTGKPFYPAAYSSVIGVGALRPDGKRWEKSNYGDFVTLAAPGFATMPVGYKGDPGTYAGTSISTAYVANRVAGYLSENPEASAQEVLRSFGPKR